MCKIKTPLKTPLKKGRGSSVLPKFFAQQVREYSWLVRVKICLRGALSWGGGGGRGVVDLETGSPPPRPPPPPGAVSERQGPTLGGSKFFEASLSHFKTSFTQIGHCYL